MSRDSLPPLEDEFTRALLGSADADAPTPAAYAKAAATLGVGVGIGASIPAAAAIGAAGAAGVARWSSSLTAKLFLGFSGALLVGGAAALLTRNSEPDQPSASVSAVHAPARTAAAALAAPAVAAPLAAPVAPAASADARSRAPAGSRAPALAAVSASSTAPRTVGQGRTPGALAARSVTLTPAVRRPSHAAPARVSVDSSLAEQVQSLDRARVALAAGDSSSALAEIAHYRSSWPSGVFLTEASVLEIEALSARGEQSRARARAADFVAAHPDSPQADRLRALLPGKKP